MKPITLRRSSEDQHKETTSIPVYAKAIVDLTEVVEIEGTVLDPSIAKDGGWIDLPQKCKDWLGRPVTRVYVPRFHGERQGRLVTLHPIHAAANQLLREIEEHGRGERTDRALRGCVKMYYRQAQRALVGKNGLLGSAVFASRMKQSGRGVCLINGDHHPKWLGVPDTIFTRLDLSHGSLVILGRDPTIWHGSMEVVLARKSPTNTFEIHPLLFKQLGADCDGDEVYIYKVPEDKGCQEEAAAQVLQFTRDSAKWPSFCREVYFHPEVDWETMDTGDFTEPMRKTVTGKSISPEDILYDSRGCLEELDERTGKNVGAECRKIALGINEETFKDYVFEQNEAQLDMKINLGPIGAAANRLKTISGTDPELMMAASYLSERIQQVLMDTKHDTGTDRERPVSAQDLIDLLNRRGKYHSYSLEDATEVFESVHVDTKIAGPMLRYLWIGYPLTVIIHRVFKDLTPGRKKRYLNYVRLYIQGQMTLDVVMRHFKIGCNKTGHDLTKITQMFMKGRPGLNELCSKHYPLYDLISDVVANNPERCTEVLERVFIQGKIDTSSINRQVYDEVIRDELEVDDA